MRYTDAPEFRVPVAPIEDADYRLMVDAVSDYAIFMLDPDGRILSWNAGAQRLKGYAAEEVIGRSFEVFYPAEKIEQGFPKYELREAISKGRMEDQGWRLRKDGSRFWANVVITALFDPAGRHRGFTKVTRDLTEQREHQERLRQSEERFRLMVEGVRDYAIFMLDPEGYIVSWNLGAQMTKGYRAEEIIGRHFSVFYPQELLDRDWPRFELETALRDGRYEEENWRVRKDGTRFWANVVITALYDEQGEHRGFAKVTRDLTERRRISMLEDQGRHLTQFLAILSHELRNPLAPIANAVSIMQLENLPPGNMRNARDILDRQVQHLRRLVDDLLDLGRVVSGKVHLEREPLRLQQVVADGLEAVEPVLHAHRHQLAVDLDDEPLWVDGDRVRLVQVLTNLLNNAAKFTPPGGLIRVSLVRRGDKAELAVRDNGRGIPPEKLQYVFTLFAQSEQHGANTHGGLGIGLGLVRQIVALHNGDVSAFSTGVPGEGSEFVVHLPLIDPSPAAEPV